MLLNLNVAIITIISHYRSSQNLLLLLFSAISKRSPDMTKKWGTKTEQLLRVDDHDFTMRPGFGGGCHSEGTATKKKSCDGGYTILRTRKLVKWDGSTRNDRK